MRALRWHGARDLRLENIDVPVPEAGEVLVNVEFCGICGTDLHEYLEGPVMIRASAHPLTGVSPPFALGHEFSGRVAAVGSDVDGIEIGQRVTADPCLRCGSCFWCRRGDYNICEKGGAIGLASPGALAEFVRVPAPQIIKLPSNVSTASAALAEPYGVALHALDRGRVQRGDRILILGFGPVGAAVLLAALAVGAQAFVSEPLPQRRQRALELGAIEAFDPVHVNVKREVFAHTDHVGPDVAFECSGIPAVLADAIDIVRRGGRVVAVGIGHGKVSLNPRRIVFFERELVGALGYRGDVARAVELMAAGRLPTEALISDRIPLDDAVHGAFEALVLDRGEKLKVLIEVSGASSD